MPMMYVDNVVVLAGRGRPPVAGRGIGGELIDGPASMASSL